MSLKDRLGYGKGHPVLFRIGPVDYNRSPFAVSLPHSCDAWQITRENPTKAEALEDLDEFIAEAFAARAVLARMGDGVDVTGVAEAARGLAGNVLRSLEDGEV